MLIDITYFIKYVYKVKDFTHDSDCKVLDELAPLKSGKPKKRMLCKWYTDEIHLMRQLRGKNESIWRKSGLEVHRMIYINHRNEVNQAIRKAKCDYYIALLEKADVKVDFWPLRHHNYQIS